MKSLRLLLVAALASGVPAATLLRAQSALPEARPSAEEVRAIRQLVEKQGRQIEELRQAVDELSKVVQLKEGTPAPAAPAPAPPPAAPTAPPASPAPEAVATVPAEPRVERAEPAGTQHTVEKGETLTSIAKHYNVSITELHKANKITDDRKLQIGQILRIPTQKTAETPTAKKETH